MSVLNWKEFRLHVPLQCHGQIKFGIYKIQVSRRIISYLARRRNWNYKILWEVASCGKEYKNVGVCQIVLFMLTCFRCLKRRRQHSRSRIGKSFFFLAIDNSLLNLYGFISDSVQRTDISHLNCGAYGGRGQRHRLRGARGDKTSILNWGWGEIDFLSSTHIPLYWAK